MSQSLEDFARGKLGALEQKQLRRSLFDTERLEQAVTLRNGKKLISFACNDYLNLSQHPEIKRAAIAATERYGVGSGASRLVTGNHPLFRELESRLAELKGTDDACVFGSGYLANLGIIPTLIGPDDLLIAAELSHACILAAGTLTRARTFLFHHNDIEHAAQLLDEHRASYAHTMLVTDGVFSMDGDLAPIEELGALAAEYDAWFMTDDAHGIGVLADGRGSSFLSGSKAAVPLQMGTLSKAIGGYGGYLCAAQPVIDLMRTRSRTFIYSTGLPPASVAASIAALDLIKREPAFAALPLEKARLFCRTLGLPEPESCIVPVLLGDPSRTLAASQLLETEGYLVTAIRPPTVPEGTARLRFTFTAAHEDHDIFRLAEIVKARIMAS
ncbi:MAG: aminotransferase class I/II-fold pyridoxal phosphate-dependent enzyme [Alphaproteobacteria bacterium]|nr:aminotransferase class I/II-fold pyridoxal phosphate-dependent enzyme [Alphaproteobacteria bacterium]